MKTQYRRHESEPCAGCAQRAAAGALFRLPELDTYKQSAQPSIHAGSSPFWGFPNTLKPRGIYDQKAVTFTVQIDDQLAQALAQFIKRVSWSEMRQNAVDDAEAYDMRDGLDQVRKALQEAGYDPR